MRSAPGRAACVRSALAPLVLSRTHAPAGPAAGSAPTWPAACATTPWRRAQRAARSASTGRCGQTAPAPAAGTHSAPSAPGPWAGAQSARWVGFQGCGLGWSAGWVPGLVAKPAGLLRSPLPRFCEASGCCTDRGPATGTAFLGAPRPAGCCCKRVGPLRMSLTWRMPAWLTAPTVLSFALLAERICGGGRQVSGGELDSRGEGVSCWASCHALVPPSSLRLEVFLGLTFQLGCIVSVPSPHCLSRPSQCKAADCQRCLPRDPKRCTACFSYAGGVDLATGGCKVRRIVALCCCAVLCCAAVLWRPLMAGMHSDPAGNVPTTLQQQEVGAVGVRVCKAVMHCAADPVDQIAL